MFWPKQLSGIVSLLLCLLHLQNVNAFVIPEELQSLLSVVYSNIPPIKKGTDSRIGFGYRLGDHADFQVMFELGPQRETRPLGVAGKNDQSFNKRQVSANEQREQLRQQELWTSTERSAASWLETWSSGMKPTEKSKGKPRIRQTVKDQPQVASDAVQQLQQLYKMATTSTSTSTAISTSTDVPSPGGSLKLGNPSGFKLPPPALRQDTNSLGSILMPTKSSADITKDLENVSLEA
ncbi:uncharacterized protein LOC117780952 isoform X2 [Drosophila innubila]|nr:uncharacterized protein LOC117780952 isoform X2 [Drosophila innubila]XP_034473543.1 uncharacterized protein LOC117780952 isoform X2 [Drosophila innubila]